MTYLVDASALGKVYHREAGTPWMHALYDGTELIFISELAVVEFASMCARYFREGELSDDDLKAMLSVFEDDYVLRYRILHFTPDVVSTAAEILATHGLSLPLRSLDALQLAF